MKIASQNFSPLPETAIAHSFVQTRGARLHVASAGDGDPVLLLHGFPDCWRLWEQTMLLIAPWKRAYAPDLRGFNLSDKPQNTSDFGANELIADIDFLVDVLGGRCAIVAHDWGGMLAWSYAARFPAKTSKLVILNAPHPCCFARQLRIDPAQRAASEYVARLTQKDAVDRLSANDFEALWRVLQSSMSIALDDTERANHVAAWSQPGALQAMLNWYVALDLPSAMSDATTVSVPSLGSASGHIKAPTMVIWGDKDGSFPVACLDGLSEWVAQLTLHRFADGGHWLLREQPALVNQLISNFLQSESN
jgi:epoxide hydrolase 4